MFFFLSSVFPYSIPALAKQIKPWESPFPAPTLVPFPHIFRFSYKIFLI